MIRFSGNYCQKLTEWRGNPLGVMRIFRRVRPLCLVVLLLCAACGSLSPPDRATLPAPITPVKLLATVFISPTPDAGQREATRLALPAQTSTSLPTRPAQATVYVGTFLGAAEAGAVGDADRFVGTLRAPVNNTAPTASACTYTPDAIFGGVWAARAPASLGCAASPAVFYDSGSRQDFERGIMVYLPSGAIYALAVTPGSEGRYWFVSVAPSVVEEAISPPVGLRVPILGFGAVWQQVSGVRAALGFARTDEGGAQIAIQAFDGGTLFMDRGSGQVFILIGTTEGIAIAL